MMEDYVNLVGELMYPKTTFNNFGYSHEDFRVFF